MCHTMAVTSFGELGPGCAVMQEWLAMRLKAYVHGTILPLAAGRSGWKLCGPNKELPQSDGFARYS